MALSPAYLSIISITVDSRYLELAYLEKPLFSVKILSLPKHENQVKKYCGKEEKLILRSIFSSFPQYVRYISNVKSPITYIFVKCGCSNYFILNSENLICRGTDISKCFGESLGIRDNESRLRFQQYFLLPPGFGCKKLGSFLINSIPGEQFFFQNITAP